MIKRIHAQFGPRPLYYARLLTIICLMLASLIAGCENATPTHRAWHGADALFRDKARFRGADSAYSVDLVDILPIDKSRGF